MNATLTAAPTSARRPLRSISAILAGLIVNAVLSSATDVGLSLAGVFPPLERFGEAGAHSNAMLALALMYRTLFGVLGCYITARLAPARPMLHALVLGGIGVAIGTAGAIAMWSAETAWYSLALIAVTFPAAWAGGRLYERRAGLAG